MSHRSYEHLIDKYLDSSHSLAGALNGNAGVAKSVIAELSDSTNMAKAFSYIPVNWAIGSTLG